MKDKLLPVFTVLRYIYGHSGIIAKIKRSGSEFFADRIIQAGTQRTLLAFVERLASIMDADLGGIWQNNGTAFLTLCNSGDAGKIYQWIRDYPRIASMIVALANRDQVEEALDGIDIEAQEETGVALPAGAYDVPIKITTLSPLSHGGDSKAGNATLFRRMQVLSNTGATLSLPFYSGNAFRGQMRDLLADHFLMSIGIEPSRTKPPVALWFFHTLYAGGALEENSDAAKAIGKFMGSNGAIKAEGVYQFRDTLPALSTLGCSLGNRVLEGRANFADYRPHCKQWSNGETDASELYTWEFLTRREDHEGHEDGENASMIANTECLKSGVVLDGGVDLRYHASELERSVLGLGITLMIDRGFIGADSRRGMGKVKIEADGVPGKALYEEHLRARKDDILSYLKEIGACTP